MTETDSRFPSGEWRGYWVQHTFTGWMEVQLTFRGGHVSGVGNDPVGGYAMDGDYHLDEGRVVLRKQYVGLHAVTYEGTADDDGHLRGDWQFGTQRGAWHLWPKGRGGKYQAVTGMADDPPVITSMQEFTRWFEEVAGEEI
ncbi:MAG: hypothetical protein AAF797_08420 [Planctomycetota bacterium]